MNRRSFFKHATGGIVAGVLPKIALGVDEASTADRCATVQCFIDEASADEVEYEYMDGTVMVGGGRAYTLRIRSCDTKN